MKIAQIREMIRRSQWLRNDFSGINSERVLQPVGPRLAEKIAELQALQIPARFVEDIAERDEEIARCRRVIARWEALRAAEGYEPCVC